MDPNPKAFPILSFVMSRLHSSRKPPDTEPPPAPDAAAAGSSDGGGDIDILERMPHLKHPILLSSMTRAIAEVAGTRVVLRTIGDRPDHESLNAARARIAAIDAALSLPAGEIVEAAPLDGEAKAKLKEKGIVEAAPLDGEAKAKLKEERRTCKAVIDLDEAYEAYGRLMKDAEERLVRMYGSAAAGEEEGPAAGEEVNEEVIRILGEASREGWERLELTGRRLRALPESFGQLQALVSLNISNNLLEMIPDSLGGLELLEELRASSNLLTALPNSIGQLLKLKILDVSGNQLVSLPDSITSCSSLVELDASYNLLAYLPSNIGVGLTNLQKLCVHLNKLRTLPSSVCEMKSLRHLDAHFNQLRGLPYSIGTLTNLETLNLGSNFSDLLALPDSFGDLANLRELDLSNNQIHALPDTFGRLEKLAKINLEQNPLVVPPVEVVNRGAVAIREYMVQRALDILFDEERKKQLQLIEESITPRGRWVRLSTTLLNKVAEVSRTVAEQLGAVENSGRDPYLDQKL